MTKEQYYYLFIALILIIGLSIQIIPKMLSNPKSTEHYIGVNVSSRNDSYVYTWLGGWDYDSFVGDVRVGGVVVKHPKPYSVIAINKSGNLPVEMYMIPVSTWIQVYPKV
jgi:hypothetical protein